MQKIDPGKALLSAIREGDRSAMQRLYDRYSAALFGAIQGIVKEQVLAEEVLQDTFLKIWKNATRYDAGKGRAFTWMLNIARNTAIDKLRSAAVKSSRNIQSIDAGVYQLSDTDPRDAIDHIGFSKVLDTLTEEKRKVIDQAYFLGFTQKEISERENIPLGTVKSRMRSALLDLRAVFEKDK